MATYPSKPTQDTTWTDGSAPKVTDPGGTKKLLGWTVNERPAFQFWNWCLWAINAWIQYFITVTDTLKTLNQKYTAIVGAGAGCTHATLALALADSAVVSGTAILIMDSVTISSTIQISKNNMAIEFMPGVTYTDGGAGTIIQISATGTRLYGGRFAAATVAGISVDAAKNWNFITENRFATCAADIIEVDAAPNNVILANISE